jgi:K+-sensing histidine kinase KdpD
LRTGESVDWFRLKAKPTAINRAVGVIGPELQSGFDWLEVEIRYNLEDGQDAALIDERLLEKCLQRLAEEIISHCPQELPVRLTLTTQVVNGRIQILAGSPEAGMATGTIEWLDGALASTRVFEPKLREFSLALLLVKGIIHHHDGQVSVMRRPGEGLTFVISLPALGR